MSSTKGQTDPQRNERDLYQTPQWCIDILADKIDQHLKLYQYGKIIDIGAGDGRIGQEVYRKFQATVHEAMWPRKVMIDIQEPPERMPEEEWIIDDLQNIDVDDVIGNENYATIIVGNPPFSLADSIVMESVEAIERQEGACPDLDVSVAIFLLRLNWLGSEKRANWVNMHPPSRLTIPAPRPSFCVRETIGEDGKLKRSTNDSCEYAWVWWENAHSKGPLVEVCRWALSPQERKAWRKKQREMQACHS